MKQPYFQPPNLQLIVAAGSTPLSLEGRSLTTIVSRAPQNPSLVFPPEDYDERIPKNTRGITGVDYYRPQDPSAPILCFGSGYAYLNADDAFHEPTGILLATYRAVTDMVKKFRPVNAADLERRLARWEIWRYSPYCFPSSIGTASQTLHAEVLKCRS